MNCDSEPSGHQNKLNIFWCSSYTSNLKLFCEVDFTIKMQLKWCLQAKLRSGKCNSMCCDTSTTWTLFSEWSQNTSTKLTNTVFEKHETWNLTEFSLLETAPGNLPFQCLQKWTHTSWYPLRERQMHSKELEICHTLVSWRPKTSVCVQQLSKETPKLCF